MQMRSPPTLASLALEALAGTLQTVSCLSILPTELADALVDKLYSVLKVLSGPLLRLLVSQKLRMSRLTLVDDSAFLSIRHLRSLRILNLSHTSLLYSDLERLLPLAGSLSHLDLSFCEKLTTRCIRKVAEFTHLTDLRLEGLSKALQSSSHLRPLGVLVKLETLSLAKNSMLSGVPGKEFRRLPRLRSLNVLGTLCDLRELRPKLIKDSKREDMHLKAEMGIRKKRRRIEGHARTLKENMAPNVALSRNEILRSRALRYSPLVELHIDEPTNGGASAVRKIVKMFPNLTVLNINKPSFEDLLYLFKDIGLRICCLCLTQWNPPPIKSVSVEVEPETGNGSQAAATLNTILTFTPAGPLNTTTAVASPRASGFVSITPESVILPTHICTLILRNCCVADDFLVGFMEMNPRLKRLAILTNTEITNDFITRIQPILPRIDVEEVVFSSCSKIVLEDLPLDTSDVSSSILNERDTTASSFTCLFRKGNELIVSRSRDTCTLFHWTTFSLDEK
eukprot:CFRG5479T1